MAMSNDSNRQYVAWKDSKGNHVLWFRGGSRGILPTPDGWEPDEQAYDWGNMSNATCRLASALITNLYSEDKDCLHDKTEYFFAREFLMSFPDGWGIHENIMRCMIEAADIIARIAR